MLRDLINAAISGKTEENKASECFVNVVHDNNGNVVGSYLYSYSEGIIAQYGDID